MIRIRYRAALPFVVDELRVLMVGLLLLALLSC
jgi:hypothetical protein